MDRRTDISSRRTTRVSGGQTRYTADGTLTRRTFCSKRIETITKVNADGDTIVRNVTRTSSNIHDYMGSFLTVRGETKARRVVTSAGYVDLTTGKRYWYVTNRQGSTMAVVDETGAVVQRNGYYPSGTPYVLTAVTDAPSLTAVTDRLHIGNRWLSHSGLNWYDNTARMHDPLLMRFATPDPLAVDFPDISPWSHCVANPANAVDPDGRIVIADEWCQQGILDGFSEEEALFIQFDKNGVLNTKLLDSCPINSGNFSDLKELAQSDLKIIAQGATKVEKEEGTYILGDDSDEGNKGETLMPDVKGAKSPDKDVHVYTSLHLSQMKRATNLAHEMYGHAVAFLNNEKATHEWVITGYVIEGDGPVYIKEEKHTKLYYRTKAAEHEAMKNYKMRYDN